MKSRPLVSIGALWPMGIPISQSPREFLASLFAIQEFKVKTYIEIGVHRGGMASLLMARECYSLGFKYYGIEIDENIISPSLWLMEHENGSILIGDVFENLEWVRNKIQFTDGSALVMCDGGNKIREMVEVEPLLRGGDLMMAHDYKKEFLDKDIPSDLERLTPPWMKLCRLALMRKT